MRFYIADAFTETLFGGNPAGVVLLDDRQDFPESEIMRKTAAELRYSETAFIKRLAADCFHLRYFTPAAEVDLCGHATVASFAAMAKAGLIPADCRCTAKTQAGDLTVTLQHGFVMMEMGRPQCLKTICDPNELDALYAVMGIPDRPAAFRQSCSRQDDNLPPAIVSTGLPDLILPVKNEETLHALCPDYPSLCALSEQYRITGVHAFAPDCTGSGITAHCRDFAPLYGIDEEAATGTASGALTYYLFEHGLISDNQECIFIQGEAMNRPSKILTRIHSKKTSEPPLIQVGGDAAILASGQIHIEK